jgi:L-lactate dehydrogenase (cytochrome)
LCDILDEKAKMDEESGSKMGMVFQVYLKDRQKNAEVIKEAIDGGCT